MAVTVGLNVSFSELEELRSEAVQCDLARWLVLSLALRNVFELPLVQAHALNDFTIRPSCLDLFLFGSLHGGFLGTGYVVRLREHFGRFSPDDFRATWFPKATACAMHRIVSSPRSSSFLSHS